MKQHITVEQLNELSKNARKKYALYCTGKSAPLRKVNIRSKNSDLCEYLMDIGQMIEFLTKDNQTLRIEKWGTEEWTLGEIYNSEEYKNEHKGELCDALWEAVKEVLE